MIKASRDELVAGAFAKKAALENYRPARESRQNRDQNLFARKTESFMSAAV